MIEHRTIDTGELAPYPGMTSDDLRDFEAWSDEVEYEFDHTRFYSGCLWLAILAVMWFLGTMS